MPGRGEVENTLTGARVFNQNVIFIDTSLKNNLIDRLISLQSHEPPVHPVDDVGRTFQCSCNRQIQGRFRPVLRSYSN